MNQEGLLREKEVFLFHLLAGASAAVGDYGAIFSIHSLQRSDTVVVEIRLLPHQVQDKFYTHVVVILIP